MRLKNPLNVKGFFLYKIRHAGFISLSDHAIFESHAYGVIFQNHACSEAFCLNSAPYNVLFSWRSF